MGTGLSRAEFTLLARPHTTSRAPDSQHLFESQLLHLSLPFWCNGHGSSLREADDQGAIYLQAAVVADEAFFLEFTHQFTWKYRSALTTLSSEDSAHAQSSAFANSDPDLASAFGWLDLSASLRALETPCPVIKDNRIAQEPDSDGQ